MKAPGLAGRIGQLATSATRQPNSSGVVTTGGVGSALVVATCVEDAAAPERASRSFALSRAYVLPHGGPRDGQRYPIGLRRKSLPSRPLRGNPVRETSSKRKGNRHA